MPSCIPGVRVTEPRSRLRSRGARAGDAVTEWAFASGWQVVRHLPERAAYATFDRAAVTLWKRNGAGVQQLRRNMARARPSAGVDELEDLTREAMRSYLRYWCDTFRLPQWSPARIRETFLLDRRDRMDDALAAGTGAIMVVNHAGNWDHAGAWGALRYGGLTTVVERLRPEGLYEQFLAYRNSLGMETLPTGDPDVVRVLARRLQAGRLVPLMGDRDISRRGVIVDLLGQPASFPAGPALLAQLTDAPLYPVTLSYEEDRAVGVVHERVPVPTQGTRAERLQAVTQGIADAFSAGIAAHPVDWHMMQPVWLEDLDPARLASRQESGPDSHDVPAVHTS